VLHEFGGHVLFASTKRVRIVFLLKPKPAHAKISNPQMALNVNQNILWLNQTKNYLQIPVKNLVLVQVLHCQNNLTKVHFDVFFLQLDFFLSAEVEKEFTAWVIIEKEVKIVLGLK